MAGMLAATFASRPTLADYPSPATAGFHHCALIYDRATRTADDLGPYVARTGAPRAGWLFDAFLFLIQTTPDGARTEYGATRRSGWQYHLDRWFAPGRDLHALDDAIERAAARLGAPPSPRSVMLSIPYPSPEVRDFDDIDGDGRGEDLATGPGRRAVLHWYLDEARRRFREARFRHLRLWGFYWMREDIGPGDAAAVRQAADEAHAGGQRLLWIPWYRADGWNGWRERGIDVAVLQPNYAFAASTHGGRVRRNRLAVAADLARGAGLGVEMEAGAVLESPLDRLAFLHYLADGMPERLGYRAGAQAYYLGTDTVERLARGRATVARHLYASLADYVSGLPVTDPTPAARVRRVSVPGGAGLTLELPSRRAWTALDLFLDEQGPRDAWAGVVRVESPGRGGRWEPARWAVRPGPNPLDDRRQVVTVPLSATASRLRVTLRPAPGSPPLHLARAEASGAAPTGLRAHAALGASYRFEPAAPAAYSDRGGELTDGRVSDASYSSGDTVGWYGASVAVALDLGATRRVTAIRAWVDGGSGSAVNWPARAVAFLTDGRASPRAFAGRGALPDGFEWAGGAPPVVTFRRSATDMTGRLDFRLSRPVRARHVTLLFEPNAWLMLREVSVLSGAAELARGRAYTLAPPPTPVEQGDGPAYPDDGARLTDGVVAEDFVPRQLTGWQTGEPGVVTLDLGRVAHVSEVTAWSLRGGAAAIYGPAEVGVELSRDGERWTRLGVARKSGSPENDRLCVAAAYTVRSAAASRARYVRVRVRPDRGWAMLSEVEVR
ncbi:MAG: DUF4855 domain-containing protein [Chthonomonadales bacterium]|nr:DUF4855 domain-containing protein [Chthonomonadales bacterium]